MMLHTRKEVLGEQLPRTSRTKHDNALIEHYVSGRYNHALL